MTNNTSQPKTQSAYSVTLRTFTTYSLVIQASSEDEAHATAAEIWRLNPERFEADHRVDTDFQAEIISDFA